MEKLLNTKQLKTFFKNQKLRCIIKKGGATMFDNMFNEIEQVEQAEEQTVEETKEEQKEKKEKNIAKAPLTLEEARQNLEYELLKNYLSKLNAEQQSNFINSQVNLNSKLKDQLFKALSISE